MLAGTIQSFCSLFPHASVRVNLRAFWFPLLTIAIVGMKEALLLDCRRNRSFRGAITLDTIILKNVFYRKTPTCNCLTPLMVELYADVPRQKVQVKYDESSRKSGNTDYCQLLLLLPSPFRSLGRDRPVTIAFCISSNPDSDVINLWASSFTTRTPDVDPATRTNGIETTAQPKKNLCLNGPSASWKEQSFSSLTMS